MKKRHYISLAILLAGFLASAAVLRHPRQLPLEECSPEYLRYKDAPGIRASFVKNFPINDTLAVNVLLLEATSDSAFCALLRDFGEAEDLINLYITNRELFVGEDVNAIEVFCIDKNDTKKHLPRATPGSRLVIGSYKKKSLCVFNVEEKSIKDLISLTHIQNLKL